MLSFLQYTDYSYNYNSKRDGGRSMNRLFRDILRENNDELFDGKDKVKLRKYSLLLKYEVEEYNELHPDAPLRDEKDELIEVPVAG